MSPIGRIFVVINLGLAGLFLGWAASNLATAQEYRANYETELAAKADLKKSLEDDIAALQTEKDEAIRLRSEAIAAKEEAERLKTGLSDDLNDRESELAQLKADMANIDDQIKDLSGSVKSMSSQVTAANQAKSEADEARHVAEQAMQKAVADAQEATDLVNSLNSTIADLEMDVKSKGDKLTSAETTIAIFKEKTGLTSADVAEMAPPMDGAVLKVSMEVGNGLVHINLGKNNNVKQGFVFDIFSGATYKGRARVDIVNATTCTARILDTMPGTTIMQGDRASTQI